ncbi:hypothetical protein VNO80_28683 [Phaseolus coccineus]|uniref:DUF7865 domain-containing protein n=1 Tax=Phaseolus coccineus TaxID=3886 RepID=A0AAN9QHT3_PHACN
MASSSSAFMVICILHSLIAVTSGALMMFYMKEVYTFGHGVQAATKLLGSTPHDQLLIKTSDSFSGLLLIAIGFLLFMVSFVRDHDFQLFFAKGCTLLHLFMAMWRIYFERKVEDLAWDWLRQTVGDLLLALSWVFFLVYSWREKIGSHFVFIKSVLRDTFSIAFLPFPASALIAQFSFGGKWLMKCFAGAADECKLVKSQETVICHEWATVTLIAAPVVPVVGRGRLCTL